MSNSQDPTRTFIQHQNEVEELRRALARERVAHGDMLQFRENEAARADKAEEMLRHIKSELLQSGHNPESYLINKIRTVVA